MARHKPIDQQVIVITGASSGIGLCTALLAAERGARVVLAARNADTLTAIEQQIEAAGGEAFAVSTDVAERRDMEALAEAAARRFGRIDTWVNNAGVSVYARLDEISEEDSRRLFDINFWGVVAGSRAALPHLRHTGGVLINVGSEVSDAVIPLQGMYSASKHAVKGYTDALRVEVEDVDDAPVSVVLIQPTATDTPFPQHARNYMDSEPKLPTPMIDPHRVAEAILEAATEGGRHVKVGAMARVNATTAKLLPALGDRMSAAQVRRQQHDHAPLAPEGTLYRSGGEGRVYGQEQHARH